MARAPWILPSRTVKIAMQPFSHGCPSRARLVHWRTTRSCSAIAAVVSISTEPSWQFVIAVAKNPSMIRSRPRQVPDIGRSPASSVHVASSAKNERTAAVSAACSAREVALPRDGNELLQPTQIGHRIDPTPASRVPNLAQWRGDRELGRT